MRSAGHHEAGRELLQVLRGRTCKLALLLFANIAFPALGQPFVQRLDNISIPENSTYTLQFYVADQDTAVTNLSIRAESTNETLIPSTSCMFFGLTNELLHLPANESSQLSLISLSLFPSAFQTGVSEITITITDAKPQGTNTVTTSMVLTVTKVDYWPTISLSGPQQVCPGCTLGPIPFQVSSPILPAPMLSVVARSSDQSLVKDSNIAIAPDSAAGVTNRTLTLTAEPGFGGTANIMLIVSDGNTTVSTSFAVIVRIIDTFRYLNPNPILIQDASVASPFPSTIKFSGVPTKIAKVTVTLHGFSHTFPSDVGLLLAGPNGQNVVLMNDTGGGQPGATNINLTFDQNASLSIPKDGPLITGAFIPNDNSGGTRMFLSPAPGPFSCKEMNFSGP